MDATISPAGGEPRRPAREPGSGAMVLVPVKAFAGAKARLAPALDPAARASLARRMAERVLAAADPLPVTVVCDDAEVATWARAHGATVVGEPGRGLNGAVAAGVAFLEGAGATEVVVVHADLPAARDLATVTGFGGITLVPDRRHDGTNVVCVPARSGFQFAYGAGSFRRHCAEAERTGLPWRVVEAPDLAWDVDLPADLAGATAAVSGPGPSHP